MFRQELRDGGLAGPTPSHFEDRGEWNPPWLTARQARGPPASEETDLNTEAAWIDPPPMDEQHIEDRSEED